MQEAQEELQLEHACLDMIPALQPNNESADDDVEMLLPAAVLRAAAAPLEHMLGCEMTLHESSVWAKCVSGHAGMAKVLRACTITQVNVSLATASRPSSHFCSSAATSARC